jgi:hypothetical protein
LKTEEKADLEIFLGVNNFLKEEFELFGKVYLQADNSIYFPGKESLKKKSQLGIVYYVASVAAILLLFFSIYPFFKTEIPPATIVERTQISLMQKTNPIKSISEQIEAEIYVSEKKLNQVKLADVNTIEPENMIDPENNSLASIELKEITLKELISTDYTLVENQSEYIAFADVPEEFIAEKEKKSALGRVINKNVGGLLAVFKKDKKNKADADEPGFIKFLDQSLMVFNTVTGSDKELTKVYTKDGKLASYSFEGGVVNVRKNLGKQ